MKIYIDNNFKCHLENDGTMREFELSKFDGKCKEYIEGFRYVPAGEVWLKDGYKPFNGEMVCPFVDSRILNARQAEYEAKMALNILIGSEVNE